MVEYIILNKFGKILKMSEPKGMRQVLVFDVDQEFVTLLQNALGVYGFQVQSENPHSDKVHLVDLLKPDIIFITVDTPDMYGYTIYDKVRNTVNRKIPIVLATETLSPNDFAMHRQLKIPADVYLDKRHLSREGLLDKLYGLIGLGPETGFLPTEDENARTLEKNINEIPVSKGESNMGEEYPAASHGALDVSSAEGSRKHPISNHVDLSHDQKMSKEASSNNKSDRWLSDLESKTHQLLKQLDNARRDMRFSEYSKHLPSQRDQMNIENGEFIHLKEILHESDQEIIADRNKLRELDEQMLKLKSEVEKGMERRKEITDLIDLKHNMEERIRKAEDMVTQERQAHQETQKRFEFKIAELKEVIMNNEAQSQALLRAAEVRHKNDLLKEKEERQHIHDSVTKKYSTQLAQLRSEFEEIAQNANGNVQKAKEMLAQERQNHMETYENFKSKLAEVKEAIIDKEKQHQSLLRKAEKNHKEELHIAKKIIKDIKKQHQALLRDAEEKHKSNFLRAADKYNRIVESIVSKYAKNLAQIRIDLDREQRAHQDTRMKFESKPQQPENQFASSVQPQDKKDEE